MGAIDRDTLRVLRRADRWLLACPVVLALLATIAALADRSEPTVELTRRADAVRFEVELRILQAEIELIDRELDRIDVIDRQPYYDGRPMQIDDMSAIVRSTERLDAFRKRTRGVHWSEFPEL